MTISKKSKFLEVVDFWAFQIYLLSVDCELTLRMRRAAKNVPRAARRCFRHYLLVKFC